MPVCRAGMTHPYYDLAVVATFLLLPTETALSLLGRQESTAITPEQAATFGALRRVAGALYGLVFLSMSVGAEQASSDSRDELTLVDCYRLMASGALALNTATGQRTFGRAMLREALG